MHSFADILKSVKHLSVSVLSDVDVDYEGGYDRRPLQLFWGYTVSDLIIEPVKDLVSLTLRSDQYIGLIPQSFFNDLSFPHLTSLSLTSIIFDCSYYPDNVKPDSSSEDFIIRHKSTLTYLELIACPMHVNPGTLGAYFRSWSMLSRHSKRS